MIIEKKSKFEIIRNFNTLSIHSAAAQRPASLGCLIRQYNVNVVQTCVGVLISDLNSSFSGPLNEVQIEELAIELTSGFNRNHCFETIFIACQNIKKSEIYKLTVPRIMKEMDDVFKKFSDEITSLNYNNHLANKFTDVRDSSDELKQKERDARSIANVWYEINKNDK